MPKNKAQLCGIMDISVNQHLSQMHAMSVKGRLELVDAVPCCFALKIRPLRSLGITKKNF